MKTREIKELKTKPREELLSMLKEREEQLRRMKLDLAAGKVKNVSSLRILKKDIARLHTFLRIQTQETVGMPTAS